MHLKQYEFLQEQIDTLVLSFHHHGNVLPPDLLDKLDYLAKQAKQRQTSREDLHNAKMAVQLLKSQLDTLYDKYPELGL
jgi:hypothetical protein